MTHHTHKNVNDIKYILWYRVFLKEW